MKNKMVIVVIIILLVLGIIGGILFFGKNKENAEQYNKEIQSFEYHYGSYNPGYKEYKIYTANNKIYISAKGFNGIDLNIDKEVDKSILNDISEIVKENKIYEWNEFNKSDKNVTDGNSFKLKIKYVDGKEINAYGYMKYPKNYEQGHKSLVTYLEKIK